jgi:hypothetical protein
MYSIPKEAKEKELNIIKNTYYIAITIIQSHRTSGPTKTNTDIDSQHQKTK